MFRIGIALVLAASMIIGASMAQGAGIPGAAGNVEFWRPLNGSPRQGVLFIVTHDSWGPFGSGREMAKKQSGGEVGAEWWVMADGSIIHSDSERITGHCGQYAAPGVGQGCNNRSVGIEFEGYLQKTAAQVRSGLALIRFLQERYCIKSEDVHAHRKAGGGAEGVSMEQAARSLGYKPDCTGQVRNEAIPDSIVEAGTKAPPYTGPYTQGGPLGGSRPGDFGTQFRNLLGPSQPVGQPAPGPSTPSSYGSAPVGNTSSLFGGPSPYSYPGAPTSYVPETGFTPATTAPAAAELLEKIAYPDAHGDESDAASIESAAGAKKLTDTDTVLVIPLGSTTPILVPINRVDVASSTVAYLQPTFAAQATFGTEGALSDTTFAGESSFSRQFARIIEGVRAVIAGFMRLLNAEAM